MNYREHFGKLADYNRWANQRLYDAAAALPAPARLRDVGIYFKSLQATLHHLIATDNAWMALIGGEKIVPLTLAADSDFAALSALRLQMDERLRVLVARMDDADFEVFFSYAPWAGDFKGLVYNERKKDVLTHLFNHQTHHRGHAHAALSILGVREPPPLDIFAKQITAGAAA